MGEVVPFPPHQLPPAEPIALEPELGILENRAFGLLPGLGNDMVRLVFLTTDRTKAVDACHLGGLRHPNDRHNAGIIMATTVRCMANIIGLACTLTYPDCDPA